MAGRKPGHLFFWRIFLPLVLCPVIPGAAARPRTRHDLCWAVPNVGTHSAHSRVSGHPVLERPCKKPGPAGACPCEGGGDDERAYSHIQLSNSIARSLGRASSPVFFVGAGSAVVSSCSLEKTREMARQVAQPLFVLCRVPSRERGRLMARHRGRLPYSAGRALRLPSVVPAGFAHGEGAAGGAGPGWPCSWRAARIGRRAEPRRRPSAEGA